MPPIRAIGQVKAEHLSTPLPPTAPPAILPPPTTTTIDNAINVELWSIPEVPRPQYPQNTPSHQQVAPQSQANVSATGTATPRPRILGKLARSRRIQSLLARCRNMEKERRAGNTPKNYVKLVEELTKLLEEERVSDRSVRELDREAVQRGARFERNTMRTEIPGYVFLPAGNAFLTRRTRVLSEANSKVWYNVRSVNASKSRIGLLILPSFLSTAKRLEQEMKGSKKQNDELRMKKSIQSVLPGIPDNAEELGRMVEKAWERKLKPDLSQAEVISLVRAVVLKAYRKRYKSSKKLLQKAYPKFTPLQKRLSQDEAAKEAWKFVGVMILQWGGTRSMLGAPPKITNGTGQTNNGDIIQAVKDVLVNAHSSAPSRRNPSRTMNKTRVVSSENNSNVAVGKEKSKRAPLMGLATNMSTTLSEDNFNVAVEKEKSRHTPWMNLTTNMSVSSATLSEAKSLLNEILPNFPELSCHELAHLAARQFWEQQPLRKYILYILARDKLHREWRSAYSAKAQDLCIKQNPSLKFDRNIEVQTGELCWKDAISTWISWGGSEETLGKRPAVRGEPCHPWIIKSPDLDALVNSFKKKNVRKSAARRARIIDEARHMAAKGVEAGNEIILETVSIPGDTGNTRAFVAGASSKRLRQEDNIAEHVGPKKIKLEAGTRKMKQYNKAPAEVINLISSDNELEESSISHSTTLASSKITNKSLPPSAVQSRTASEPTKIASACANTGSIGGGAAYNASDCDDAMDEGDNTNDVITNEEGKEDEDDYDYDDDVSEYYPDDDVDHDWNPEEDDLHGLLDDEFDLEPGGRVLRRGSRRVSSAPKSPGVDTSEQDDSDGEENEDLIVGDGAEEEEEQEEKDDESLDGDVTMGGISMLSNGIARSVSPHKTPNHLISAEGNDTQHHPPLSNTSSDTILHPVSAVKPLRRYPISNPTNNWQIPRPRSISPLPPLSPASNLPPSTNDSDLGSLRSISPLPPLELADSIVKEDGNLVAELTPGEGSFNSDVMEF